MGSSAGLWEMDSELQVSVRGLGDIMIVASGLISGAFRDRVSLAVFKDLG